MNTRPTSRSHSVAFILIASLLLFHVPSFSAKTKKPFFSRLQQDFDVLKSNLMDGKRQKARAFALLEDLKSAAKAIYVEFCGPLVRALDKSWHAFSWRLARLVYNLRHVEAGAKRIAWEAHTQAQVKVKSLLGSHPSLSEMDSQMILLNLYVLLGSITLMSLIWFIRFILYS